MILTLESLPRYCTEEGDCLIWNQSCNSGGKPQARLDGKGWLVQRYVYFVLKERPIDAKLRLTTRCGHRMCVSPDCIVASSYGAILKRAYAKGNRSTALEYTKRVASLVKQGRTKLSYELAQEIRASDESGASIARRLGMNAGTVNRIKSGHYWRQPCTDVFTWRPK